MRGGALRDLSDIYKISKEICTKHFLICTKRKRMEACIDESAYKMLK